MHTDTVELQQLILIQLNPVIQRAVLKFTPEIHEYHY